MLSTFGMPVHIRGISSPRHPVCRSVVPDTALGLSTKFGVRGETYEFRISPAVFGHVGPPLSALVGCDGPCR